MDTDMSQLDPEQMRRNLAITLGAQQPQLAALRAPAGPEMAAPGPITLPGQDRVPNLAISAPAVSSLGGKKTGTWAPQGTIPGDKQERARQISTGAGVDQIYGKVTGSDFGQDHPIAGKALGGLAQGIGKLGDIGLSAVAPALAINLPGTEFHHAAQLHGLNKQIGAEEGEQEKEAQTAASQAEIPLRNAQTGEANARAEALAHPEPAPKEEHWTLSTEYTGPNGEPVEVEQNSGQMRPVGGATQFKRVAKEPPAGNDFEQFYKDFLNDGHLPDSAHNRKMARKEWAVASQAPERPPQALTVGPDGRVSVLRPGDTMTPGSMSPNQLGSSSAADEKDKRKRDEASQNMDSELELMKEFAASPSPTNDAAMLMHYIGATKPESMGKIRLNERELKLFGGTRSSLGDVEALFTKVANGQSLTPQQRSDMVSTMTMIRDAAKRGGDGGPANLQGGAPAANATHRWNPATGEIEEIKK